MRTKLGFISNSSSCSFLIDKTLLSPAQKLIVSDVRVMCRLIDNMCENWHEDFIKYKWSRDQYKDKFGDDAFYIEEHPNTIEIFISMDNGEIPELLDEAEIPWRAK